MPLRKKLRAKWDKLRGHSPTPEPQTQDQVCQSASVSSSTGVTAHISQQTQHSRSRTGDTVAGAMHLALDITELLSDGVPFLPGIVKALKNVVEVYEVCSLSAKACLWPSVRYLIGSALHARIMRM